MIYLIIMELPQQLVMSVDSINSMEKREHSLSHKWVLWAHLPHNTDWSLNSYIKIAELSTLEKSIQTMNALPEGLVENCMLFMMREGIKPIWEDPNNRLGGSFSYKVINKFVNNVWIELSYCVVGNTISKNKAFLEKISGITISPKKNFCIVKIWMSSCDFQDPAIITDAIRDIGNNGCLFKKHAPEY